MSSFGKGLKIDRNNLSFKRIVLSICLCLTLGGFALSSCKTESITTEFNKKFEKNGNGDDHSTSQSSQTGGG